MAQPNALPFRDTRGVTLSLEYGMNNLRVLMQAADGGDPTGFLVLMALPMYLAVLTVPFMLRKIIKVLKDIQAGLGDGRRQDSSE